jgi:uncharacterized metal-binding protein YceD (DUF177 family)
MSEQSKPEFSRLTHVNDIPQEGITLTIEATAAEREALACRFDAISIESLRGEVSLYPKQGRTCWQVEGRVWSQVVQRCVVSLNPVRAESDFSFERRYVTKISGEARENFWPKGDAVLTLDQDDAPELLTGDVIDLGEIVAEEFGLALNPFPRAPGVVFNGYTTEADDRSAATSAFAALADRRDAIEKKR